MRKQTFCMCKNKDADQLRGNREADQRLCFRYKDSTIPLLSKSDSDSTAWFVSDQVGDQNVGFLMTWLICLLGSSRGHDVRCQIDNLFIPQWVSYVSDRCCRNN